MMKIKRCGFCSFLILLDNMTLMSLFCQLSFQFRFNSRGQETWQAVLRSHIFVMFFKIKLFMRQRLKITNIVIWNDYRWWGVRMLWRLWDFENDHNNDNPLSDVESDSSWQKPEIFNLLSIIYLSFSREEMTITMDVKQFYLDKYFLEPAPKCGWKCHLWFCASPSPTKVTSHRQGHKFSPIDQHNQIGPKNILRIL